MPGGRSEASKLTAAEAPPIRPVGSVAVAETVALPAGSPPEGAQLQEPLSSAVAVHSVDDDPSVTVTRPSGSAVPEIEESSVAVWPFFGVVITGAGGNAGVAGTAGPVTDTATLCTVIGVPESRRKSAPAFSRPPK